MGRRFCSEEPFLARNFFVPTSERQSKAAVIWKSPFRLYLHRLSVDNSLYGRLQAHVVPAKHRSRFTPAAWHLSAILLHQCFCRAPHLFHRVGLGANLSHTLTWLWTHPLLPASRGLGRDTGPPPRALLSAGVANNDKPHNIHMPERNTSPQMSTTVARTVGRATKMTDNSKFSFLSLFPFFIFKK